MKKVLKVMLIFLVIFVVGFMGLATLGDNDRKKKKHLQETL